VVLPENLGRTTNTKGRTHEKGIIAMHPRYLSTQGTYTPCVAGKRATFSFSIVEIYHLRLRNNETTI
jgi:hypothetical protein